MKSFEELIVDEDLYTDEADRVHLQSLPETQREKILYDRYCALKEHEERRKLRNMVQPTTDKIAELPKPSYNECDFILTKRELLSAIFSPVFNTFKGCFVRAKVNDSYKICKIVGVVQKEPYRLYNRKDEKTDLALSLDTGTKVCKGVEITSISSQKALEEEFDSFLNSFKITSLDSIRAKHTRVTAEIGRNPTEKEQTAIIANRERANPKKKSKAEHKIELILKRDEALTNKDREGAKHYQQLIEQLENEERYRKRMQAKEELIAARRRLERRNE